VAKAGGAIDLLFPQPERFTALPRVDTICTLGARSKAVFPLGIERHERLFRRRDAGGRASFPPIPSESLIGDPANQFRYPISASVVGSGQCRLILAQLFWPALQMTSASPPMAEIEVAAPR